MEAAIIFESHLPNALQRALEYAGEEGFVASMPQLLRARINATDDNEIWHARSLTSNSEESAATTKTGKQCCRRGPRRRHIRVAGSVPQSLPCQCGP